MASPVMAIYLGLSEREFQRMVRAGLEDRGWLVFVVPDMRRTRAGWPDVLAVHPTKPGLLAWELKRQAGRVRPEQRTVLAALSAVAGVDARVVRPSDWDALRDEV